MKQKILLGIGVMGGTAASLLGGWDYALQTLVICMGIDWLIGGILLPAVFQKSPKSENGAMESRAGYKGLCRKGMIFLYILIAARVDLLLHTTYVRDAVCIGFTVNELLSIVENTGLMGVPMPDAVMRMIDVLKE